jgi:hypothetical protein
LTEFAAVTRKVSAGAAVASSTAAGWRATPDPPFNIESESASIPPPIDLRRERRFIFCPRESPANVSPLCGDEPAPDVVFQREPSTPQRAGVQKFTLPL